MQKILSFLFFLGSFALYCSLNWAQAIDSDQPSFKPSDLPEQVKFALPASKTVQPLNLHLDVPQNNANTSQSESSYSEDLTPRELEKLASEVSELEALKWLDAAVADLRKKELVKQAETQAQLSTLTESPPVVASPTSVTPFVSITPGIAPSAIPPSAITPTLTPPVPVVSPAPPISPLPSAPPQAVNPPPKTILINFSNVSMIELIRFISRVSNKNFIFDESDLQFTVTIISEEPTTIENIMAALLQELRIHGLNLIEEGNNIIIHKAPGVSAISKIVVEGSLDEHNNADIITQLFRLNTLDADNVASLIRPLISDKAFLEVLKETNYLVVTDIVTNLEKVAQLLKVIDKPNGGLVIGQYVVNNSVIDVLVTHVKDVMTPLSQGQTLIFVPHYASNSIFIVSSPFLVSRTMTILQYLDQNQGLTRIFDEDISPLPRLEGEWKLDAYGNWIFYPSLQGELNGAKPPNGHWELDSQGNWRFLQGNEPGQNPGEAPKGNWMKDANGNWVFKLASGASLSPSRVNFPSRSTAALPLGHIERMQFLIYKLHYRKGDEIQEALGRIGESLSLVTAENNADLINAINSIQWIEASNSLILTGTGEAVNKIKQFITEIDLPLRQVFIEMLILDTTIEDSLEFSVDFGARFKEPSVFGAEGFNHIAPPTGLTLAMDQAANAQTLTSPDPGVLTRTIGFNLGIVGQHLTFGGLSFNTIGALIKALRNKTNTNVILNPKILTEDNYPAEVFVGLNTQFPVQAIVNDQGTILTQNYEYRNVGSYLKVTPLIGDNGVVTLLIEQDISNIVTNVAGTVSGAITTSLSTTKTKVHLPDGYFLVLSGMLQDSDQVRKISVPCLGAIPFLGAAFADRTRTESKRNLMIFIRPQIVDTIADIQDLTRHQQDVLVLKNREKSAWKYETDEALEFFNLKGAFNCDGCPDPCGDDY